MGDSGRGGLLDFVQFRPVPALDSDREVKNIGNVPLEYRTLATTPFVKGSYSVEAPLYRPIMPDFKNRPYWIEMPHIQVEGKGNNASRSYMDDPYAEALINSDFASSLAHEEQIGYSFKERDSWKEMGVLEEGFWEYVENFMQEGHVKDEMGIERPYEISSVPFRIDSDGRKGKISIHKDYLNY